MKKMTHDNNDGDDDDDDDQSYLNNVSPAIGIEIILSKMTMIHVFCFLDVLRSNNRADQPSL